MTEKSLVVSAIFEVTVFFLGIVFSNNLALRVGKSKKLCLSTFTVLLLYWEYIFEVSFTTLDRLVTINRIWTNQNTSEQNPWPQFGALAICLRQVKNCLKSCSNSMTKKFRGYTLQSYAFVSSAVFRKRCEGGWGVNRCCIL